MSEEELKEAFGLSEPQEDQSELDLGEPDEVELMINGLPEEDRRFAKGFDPNGEKTLEQFVNDGKWMHENKSLRDKMSTMEREFQERLKTVVKLQEMELKTQEQKLRAELAEAVNMSDLEAVQNIQGRINENQMAQQEVGQQQQVNAPEEALSWDERNPWIYEQTPKSVAAKAKYQEAMQKYNGDVNAALAEVDAFVVMWDGNTPQPQEQRAPKTMPSQAMPGRQSAKRKLSMSDLSPEEKTLFKSMGKAFGSEEKFLQAVQDIRSGKQ